MKTAIVGAVIVALALGLVPSGRAQESKDYIACPLEQAQTEITTPIPKPWWNTPQVGKLEETAVSIIAGKNTLVCKYWAYATKVSVMREFPRGATSCVA